MVSCVILLVGCGEMSQEDVMKKVNKSWANANYELTAQMEVKNGEQSKVYDVEVWHTKPEFYRVEVKEKEQETSQIIIKNEEGVFLVAQDLNKMYKFQTDWPKKNSQSYLIGALAEDILADDASAMKEVDEKYVFEVATRNVERTGLPTQQIVINKKTLLPEKVSLLNESSSEQVVITFESINLKTKHSKADYSVEQYEKSVSEQSSSLDNQSFKVYYPTVSLKNTDLVDELVVRDLGNERAVLSFKGDKSYTIIQQPTVRSDQMTTVSIQGDPQQIGQSYGAIADNTLTWEQNGMSFLITSNVLTQQELLTVASSLVAESEK